MRLRSMRKNPELERSEYFILIKLNANKFFINSIYIICSNIAGNIFREAISVCNLAIYRRFISVSRELIPGVFPFYFYKTSIMKLSFLQ